MADLPHTSELLALVKPFIDSGFALHRLKERAKRPEDMMWSTTPVHDFDSFSAAYRPGENIGVRLGEPSLTASGYLQLIDLDIRDASKADAAYAKLRELWPDHDDFPSVVSGSGGASRHFYFFASQPFASRKLAHADTFAMVFDKTKNRDVKKWDWEIELFGTGKQAVIPPSIHPDTGNPYIWERPIDLDLVEMGCGPVVTSELLERWGAWADEPAASGDDDLLTIYLDEPLGVTAEEAAGLLADLPTEDWRDDRDGWLQAGMALHHEFRGSEDGLKLWNDWSSSSEKYDAKDQKRVWKSFGDYRGRPVRMATLKKAAMAARFDREHEQVEVDDLLGTGTDLDDLLGPMIDDFPNLPAISVPKKHDPNWMTYLQRTEDGGIKCTLHNMELLIRNDIRTRGIIAFNEFTQEVVLLNRPGTFKLKKPGPKPVRQLDGIIWNVRDEINGDLWSDSHDHAIRTVLEAPNRQGGYGLKVSDRDLRAATDIVAHEHAFHPVRDHLLSLKWDGVKRIERLFVDYLNTEDTAYHRMTAAMFLTGAVARVMEPGHKFDFVPILEGMQGKKKSTFAATLSGNDAWFSELEGDFHDAKGMVEKMQGSWILEIPELQGFSKSDVTIIKGFISRRSDKVRLAYAKRASVFHRQCVFIGSTNESQYLRDETGNRRFWPIYCNVDKIDIDRLAEERDDLWAEAVAVYQEMRRQQPYGTLPLYLSDKAAEEEAALHQEDRRLETQEEGLTGEIEHWLNLPLHDDDGFDDETAAGGPRYRDETCVREVWVEMQHGDLKHLDQRQSMKIGKALRMLGGWYAAGRSRTKKYGLQRVFRRAGAIFPDSTE
jgi:predicted P-loop ATPase